MGAVSHCSSRRGAGNEGVVTTAFQGVHGSGISWGITGERVGVVHGAVDIAAGRQASRAVRKSTNVDGNIAVVIAIAVVDNTNDGIGCSLAKVISRSHAITSSNGRGMGAVCRVEGRESVAGRSSMVTAALPRIAVSTASALDGVTHGIRRPVHALSLTVGSVAIHIQSSAPAAHEVSSAEIGAVHNGRIHAKSSWELPSMRAVDAFCSRSARCRNCVVNATLQVVA